MVGCLPGRLLAVCQPTVGHVGPLSAYCWSTVYRETIDRFLGEQFVNFTKRCFLSDAGACKGKVFRNIIPTLCCYVSVYLVICESLFR